MRRFFTSLVCIKAAAALTLYAYAVSAGAASASAADMTVTVERNGDLVVVDAGFDVAVTPREAWQVLTDYEHMTQFLPNLTSSTVLMRNESTLRVSQNGRIPFGPFWLSFEYVRAIDLVPYREIRSHAVGGSLRKGEVVTRLEEHGAGTRVLYHSELVPAIWVPFGIGSMFVRRNIGEQLASLRSEMMRRQEPVQ